MTQLNCTVMTPEATALDEGADFVAVPLYDGEIGIGHNHRPLIGHLGYGELRLRRGNETLRYYVDGGFVQVAENRIAILTNRTIPAASIDTDAARQQLEDARAGRANSPELLQIRERLVNQARGQLRVAARADK